MATIEKCIENKIGEVRVDNLDISFGEIISLHKEKELIIQPEFQRLFRWTFEQRSRLIESILLELPIPQVFVIENENGVYELIDGLQRISSVIHFIDSSQIIDLEHPLELTGCDLVDELNGIKFIDLPLTLKLRIKRSTVRMVVIKKQSNPKLKYEMFKRFNIGGSLLSAQEVRNCSVRMMGVNGIKFGEFIIECASSENFMNCTSTIFDKDKKQRLDEELVLRFFAAKNSSEIFRRTKNIRDWLDTYLEDILINGAAFDYEKEKNEFLNVFKLIDEVMGEAAFVRHRNGIPIGSLAPAYFEAVSVGMCKAYNFAKRKNKVKLKASIIDMIMSEEFKIHIGPGSNKISNLNGRIECIVNAIKGA